ncbi:LysM peptidoglycan-binding domain-containing protein [Alicyclobacillus mali]|uniref:LysM peptidoglycan-binding domain-containing protein n=1 Tax=Alicyclobacillus mali (ex Roth et al. 2021) TaxID=1123961 RepID=A0ABS0F6D5_9BACL|nr:LysM domain-containing protein [Alicyclobacillus mali (ex Roth et al. 2021)]MBF8378866.1 LysM peptidoglycan-binding domain-containing protein [Alicyclobacillus mali (ex Roth et al. 2021)]MCL6489225.1 LysM peptidoglycan-binding domain-containing protein [Alicyclobacillus mali (ex Roth et al. 2021)]
MKKYVVKPGESLYQISRKTGVRLPLILAANPQIQNANDITPGMTIVIPELGKGTSSKPKSKKTQSKSTKTVAKPYFGYVWPHAVQPGETWATIAERYNVAVDDLEHLNPALAGRALTPGLVVYVPLGNEPQMPAGMTEGHSGAWMPSPGMAPSAPQLPGDGDAGALFGGQGHQGTLQQPPEVMPDEGVEPWTPHAVEAPDYEEPGDTDGLSDISGQEMPPGLGYDGGPHMHHPYRKVDPLVPETDEEGWSKPFVVRVGNDR